MNRMMIALTAVLAVASATMAKAQTYDFNYVTSDGPSGVETASGAFTTSGIEVNGAYAITGVSGTANTSTITGLSPYADSDNDYYVAEPHFSFGGFSFSTASGVDYNLFSNNGGYYVISSAVDAIGYASSGSPVTSLTISAAPEPATWALMIAGLAGAGLMLRRSRRIGAPQRLAGAAVD